jgi:predicted nucleotidyltransferase/HEPN domain-containing protein
MKTSLDHLPEAKRGQIAAIAALLQAEAPVEMVILFGSYARGDWVEDPENLYFSDFDLLAVVATEEQARDLSLWPALAQRARAIAGRTPVSLIVHDIKEINQELRLGQYFFIDILREGVQLYTSKRYSLASPKALTQADRLQLGLINFRYWFASANDFWRTAGHAAGRGLGPQAAFLLHQATERYFHTALLVFTGYKPKLHDIEKLANQAAPLHPSLEGALPRAEPEDRALFDLLKRAYIEARYSKSYRITADELRILRERVRDLAVRVRQACEEKLASFCGAEQVGPLPEVPSPADAGELAEAPSPDDTAAFQAWREALTALAYERGQQEGEQRGFDRGKQEGITEGFDRGITEGQIRALFSILAARNISVDAEARAKIDACREPEVVSRWIARAMTANSTSEIFEPESAPDRS